MVSESEHKAHCAFGYRSRTKQHPICTPIKLVLPCFTPVSVGACCAPSPKPHPRTTIDTDIDNMEIAYHSPAHRHPIAKRGHGRFAVRHHASYPNDSAVPAIVCLLRIVRRSHVRLLQPHGGWERMHAPTHAIVYATCVYVLSTFEV
jgi:hypothetical protein